MTYLLPGMLPVWPFLPNQARAQELFMILSTLRPYNLTLSTNKPKNVAHVYCAALAVRGALALLIMFRDTCQDLLCICSEMKSRSPGIESHYHSAPTSYHENKGAA